MMGVFLSFGMAFSLDFALRLIGVAAGPAHDEPLELGKVWA